MAILNGKPTIENSFSKFSAKQIKKRIVKNFLDIIILIQIKQRGSLSGYDIVVSQKANYQLSLSAGTIYTVLYSLERDGLIKGESNDKKTVFSLTPKGEEALADFNRSSAELTEFMKSFFQPNDPRVEPT